MRETQPPNHPTGLTRSDTCARLSAIWSIIRQRKSLRDAMDLLPSPGVGGPVALLSKRSKSKKEPDLRSG